MKKTLKPLFFQILQKLPNNNSMDKLVLKFKTRAITKAMAVTTLFVITLTACQPMPYERTENIIPKTPTEFLIAENSMEKADEGLSLLLEQGLSQRWYDVNSKNKYRFQTKYISATGTLCRKYHHDSKSNPNTACKVNTSWRILPSLEATE